MQRTVAVLSGLSRWQRVLDAVPPTAATVVMGTAIICVDLSSVGQPMVGAVLLWFAVVTWLFLAAVLGMRLLNEPDRFAPEARLPAALTGIASTCVLGSAFVVHGYYPVAAGLLGLGAAGWALLVIPVVSRWKTPRVRGSFLVAVATQGVVVLSATLAARDGVGWLLVAAVIVWILGLSAYVVALTRFDLRQLLTGRGDQWIAGGALAISALACAKIVQGIDAMGWLASLRGSLADVPLAFWCLAMLWLGPLIVAEALRPRLSYDVRRWATIFPLGMYAALSFAVGHITGIAGITDFARVWTWVAVIAGLFALAGLTRRSWQVLSG